MPNPQTKKERDPLEQFQSLPGPLRAFLASAKTKADLQKLFEKYKFPDETLDGIVELIADIEFGDRPFTDLLTALTVEIKLPADQAKKFASDLAGAHFLPVADLINADVWGAIKSWGGEPSAYPVVKIEARQATAEEVVREVIRAARLDLPERMQERLKFALVSKIKNVRDEPETREMLVRSNKVGGVELSPEVAEQIMSLLRLKLAGVLVVSEKPKTVIAAPQILPPPPPKPTRPSLKEALPAAKKFTPAAEPEEETAAAPQNEAAEIETFRQKLAAQLPKENDVMRRRREGKEAVLREAGLKLEPELMKRLGNIVDARLRDLRDAIETRTLLGRSKEVGGLGLAAPEAEHASNLIEAEFRALQGLERAEGLREQHTARQMAELQKKSAPLAAAKKEEAEREALVRGIAQKSKLLQEKEVLLPPPPPKPTPPTSKTESKPSAPQPPASLEPPAPRAVLSAPSIPREAGARPNVQDVKVARKLAGPVEELASMTLVQFRRLSKDPPEAALKIKDRIDMLKEQGYEQYRRGIKGWQQSEPHRLYLALTRAALEAGSNVPAVISQRQSAGQPTLTQEEFQAILALNAKLRM